MSLRTQSIPALYGGVSQQAAAARSSTQCELALNCSFSVARGASKRPPLETVTQLTSTDVRDSFFFWTRHSTGRWFLIMVPGNGSYSIYDVDNGNKITTSNDTAQTYLTSAGKASEDFYAVAIDDKVYVVNRTIATALTEDVAPGTLSGTAQTLQDDKLDNVTDGTIWKILGDESNAYDQYYVKADGSGVNATFFEWIAPGTADTIAATKMPHIITIIEDAVNPFGVEAEFGVETWAKRLVGDADSNKAPSFVGFPIDSLFFDSDRLGIISRQNTIMSQVGEYADFWRSTVTDVLDDDRIDVKINAFEVSQLYYAETVARSLILFANERQFSMDGNPALTPNSVSVTPITAFPSERYVRPVTAGPTVFFASDAGEFTHLREMFVQDDTVTLDAANVTSHVPWYIPRDVRSMAVHSNFDHLLMHSPVAPSSLWSYQFYWSGEEKGQSAWGEWQIAGDVEIVSLRAIGPYMYCVYHFAGNASAAFVGRFNLKDGDYHDGFTHKIHLDHLQKVVPTYNAVEDRTYFVTTFPMMDNSKSFTPYLVRGAGSVNLGTYETPDNPWTFYRMNDNQFFLTGDWTGDGDWWAGLPYEQRYRFSEQFYVEEGRAQLHARTQIRTFTVHFTDTGFFKTEVKVRGHETVETEIIPALHSTYSARTVGDEYFKLNKPMLVTGTHQFPVLSRASDLILDLVNATPLPSSFQSAEWKALISRRTQR